MKLSKKQKWTLGLGFLGFVVLLIVADTTSFLLGKFGTISDSTVTSLQRSVPGVLYIMFMAFWISVYNRGEKEP